MDYGILALTCLVEVLIFGVAVVLEKRLTKAERFLDD